MASHFHEWIDYKGLHFQQSSQQSCYRMGSQIVGTDFGKKNAGY